MLNTVNDGFMERERDFASGFGRGRGGMMHVQRITLLPHTKLYRFGPLGAYGAAWWFGVSAHDALERIARAEGRELHEVARERLAIPPDWKSDSLMNLLAALVRQPLSAWSGTPNTATVGHGGKRWEPDRMITQLYVPGLCRTLPDGTVVEKPVSWTEVFTPLPSEG